MTRYMTGFGLVATAVFVAMTGHALEAHVRYGSYQAPIIRSKIYHHPTFAGQYGHASYAQSMYSQVYNSGWHGGYPDVQGKQISKTWAVYEQTRAPHTQVNIFTANAPRAILVNHQHNPPVSVRINSPTYGSRLPAGWYKHYHVGDVLDNHIFRRSRIMARMPRGVVRIRIDNVIIQLHEDSRKIIAISVR